MAVSRRSILRLLDANCNRVREGLRVAEDAARFVLDRPDCSTPLKRIRHEVTRQEEKLFRSARLRGCSRDVLNDPGRASRLRGEAVRRDARQVFHANLKRAQEGLRSLEEFTKLLKHPTSAAFKRLRFSCYRVEETLSAQRRGD